MTQLFLIRHGDYERDTDSLTQRGQMQAERLRARLAVTREIQPDVFISSTLTRAQETAAILAPAFDANLILDSDVEEWHNSSGDMSEEDLVAALQALPPDQRVFFKPIEHGESWVDFQFRACNALNRITQDFADQTICVVCHGGIIEASFLLMFSLSTLSPPPVGLSPTHTSITHWHYTDVMGNGRWMLERFNDALHLRNDIDWY